MSAKMAPCDGHAWLIRTLSSRPATEAVPCDICVCVRAQVCMCVYPGHLLLKRGRGGGGREGDEGGAGRSQGSASPSKKWQRRQLNLCSVPSSLHPTSLKARSPHLPPPSLPIDRSSATGPWIPMIRSASEPITCTALMYAVNVNHPGRRRWTDHWNIYIYIKKGTHAKVLNAKHLSPRCRSPSVSLREGRWDSCTMRLVYYQLSMNVNRPVHMCIHHSQTLMCQKIRARRARGHVWMSDVCAKRLSFMRTINYTNNIQSLHVY